MIPFSLPPNTTGKFWKAACASLSYLNKGISITLNDLREKDEEAGMTYTKTFL